MTSPNLFEWAINGVTIATFIVVVIGLMKWSSWATAIGIRMGHVEKLGADAHERIDSHLEGHV